jgi:hypothetical protein
MHRKQTAERKGGNGLSVRSDFDDAAGLSPVVKKIFFEIKETLVIFGVILFQFFIEKTSQRSFLGVSFNEPVTHRRAAL